VIVLRSSGWTYKTGATGSGNIGPILFSGGNIILDDPAKRMKNFSYRGVGMGATLFQLPTRFELPKIPLPKFILKNGAIAGSGATTDFFGGGLVCIMPGLGKADLQVSDFEGATIYIDVSAGVLMAAGVSLLLCGISQHVLVSAIMNPPVFMRYAINSARAALVIYGSSEGLVDSFSAGLMFGGMKFKGDAGLDTDS
jgi:hypothetical protein